MIKGITVELHNKTQTGTDNFGQPVFTDTVISVANVLVNEPSTDDIVNATQLYGKRLSYTLAIPKGDQNDWTDTEVKFFNKTFHTFGEVTEGIEANIPLSWNKKVKVELYE